jgi:hypothetical protein
MERRSWSRILAAHALASLERGTAEKILRRNWPGDDRASMIYKAAVSSTSLTTSGLPLIDVVGAFRSLATVKLNDVAVEL